MMSIKSPPNILALKGISLLAKKSIARIKANTDNIGEQDLEGIQQNYLYYFIVHKFWEGK